MRTLVQLSVVVLALFAGPSTLAQGDGSSDQDVLAFEQAELNPMLGELVELDLLGSFQTPQATMEFFIRACSEKHFERAAHAMNFRTMPELSASQAAQLAERLYFVMNQELWIDWESLPDRPDGMDDSSPLNQSGPMIGKQRRSIAVGSIDVDGKDAVVRLQRVRIEGLDGAVRWLISPFTVQNIDALYEAHGPGWLDERMPAWARVRGWGRVMLWQWGVMILVLLIAPAAAYGLTWGLRWLLNKSPLPRIGLYKALHWPVTVFLATILVSIAFGVGLSLPGNVATFVDPIVLLSVAATGAWVAMRTMNFIVENIAKKAVKHSHDDDEDAQQSILTSITVIRHVLVLVIAAVALGIVLAQLDGFRSIGVALLSSAGAVALIVGIAGHAVLGNLIAGLQIAFTKPFTLGDSVYIEDNYGTIEDITYTYVIVRTWDYRRLVLPIRYFIDHSFENWSLRDAFLTKPIYLHVDYSAKIEAIREKFLELVKADEDWAEDRDEPKVLAYEAKEESLIVRLTCAAKDPSTAWSLHCRLREQMVTWLQDVEDGRWLPRQRLDVARLDEDDRSSNGDAPSKTNR